MTARRAIWRGIAYVCLATALGGSAAALDFPPRPGAVFGDAQLRTPPLLGATFCPGLWESLGAPVAQDPEDTLAALDSGEWQPAGAALLASALRAHLAEDEPTRRSARSALEDALLEEASGPVTACALVELARIEIRFERFPEASAATTRALRIIDGVEAARALQRLAYFLRAEARYLAGEFPTALQGYVETLHSSDPQLAGAARLRLADLRFDQGRIGESLPEYEALLDQAEALGANRLGWGPRAVEAAIASESLETAATWLEELRAQAPTPEDHAAWTIRLADILAAQGEKSRARDLLIEVDGARIEPLAALARVRAIDLELEPIGPGSILRALRGEIAQTESPGLATYARAVLAERLLARGRSDAALPLLVRVSFDAPNAEIAHLAVVGLSRVVRSAAEESQEPDGCRQLVQRLIERQSILIRVTTDPAPYVRLGECHEALELPRAARDVYRRLTRRFGAEITSDIALPTARVSLALGDARTAIASGKAHMQTSRTPEPAWRLLLASAHLAAHEPAEAAAVVAPIVAEPSSHARPALLAMARALSLTGAKDTELRLLRDATLRRSEEAPVDDELAHAAFLSATLHRRALASAEAVQLYEVALAALPSGAQRTESSYWLGRLTQSPESLQAAANEAPAAFADLAASRAALDRLRVRVGLDEPPR